MTYLLKEWKEQSRGMGLWLSLSMVALLSIVILFQTKQLPIEQGFEVFLLSLNEMHVYFIPLVCLFIASFSIIQEKELKTLMIILTKQDSYRFFLIKKSVAIQCMMMAVFIIWYFILAIPSKFYFQFHSGHFLVFLLTTIVFVLIFNQIGILIGSICNTKMQLIGANIFTWFLFIFLIDFLFLYKLPDITYENIKVFSIFYFLDPLHSIRFYIESSLGMISLNNMSRLMEKLVWLSPGKFLIINLFIWVVVTFELAVWLHRKGEKA